MSMVQATLTGAITGNEYRESPTSHRHLARKVTVRAGAPIRYDPDKYVFRSQPIVLRNGRTVWVSIADLTRHSAVNAYQGESRRRRPNTRRAVTGRSRERVDELTRGMAVIVKEGSPLRNRFGLVNRLVVKPGGSLDEDRYLVRVAQPGGGWRTVEFRRGDLRLPAGGRPRTRRAR